MGARRAVVLVLVTVAVTACSGDDDSASSTLPSTTAEVTAPTTTSAPPPTTVPTTTTTTSTTTTSAPPPTTDPTTTTEPPLDEAIQARLDVVEAVRESYQASLEAVREPENEAKASRLDDLFVDPLLQGWKNVLQRYRTENLREIENPEEPDSFDLELASLAVNESLTSATAQGCSVTSGIIVEVGGNADGTDRVVEDGISRTVVEFEVRRVGAVWKVASVREPDEFEAIASCG